MIELNSMVVLKKAVQSRSERVKGEKILKIKTKTLGY